MSWKPRLFALSLGVVLVGAAPAGVRAEDGRKLEAPTPIEEAAPLADLQPPLPIRYTRSVPLQQAEPLELTEVQAFATPRPAPAATHPSIKLPTPRPTPAPVRTPTVALNGFQQGSEAPLYVFVLPVVGAQAPGSGPVSVQVRREHGSERVEVLVPTGNGATTMVPGVLVTPGPVVTTAPFATPLPTAPPINFPSLNLSYDRQVSARADAAIVSEKTASGGVDLDPGLVPGAMLDVALPLGGAWGLDGRLGYRAYTLTDAQAAESQHHRDEFDFRLGARYDLGWASVGLGGWARLVSIANNFPMPLNTPFVTAASQFYVGPRLSARSRLEPLPGLYLEGELAALPYTLARGDATVEGLAPLYGASASVLAGWRPLPWLALEAGYRFDRLAGFGSDYVHTETGPSLGLGGRF
ncbi:MAG: hypothetical protein JWM80_3852 [Cyanobacteria bacterium RYN_339]|nr:hypothetical protein [Cyanobacteria bacterium RYN_339]